MVETYKILAPAAYTMKRTLELASVSPINISFLDERFEEGTLDEVISVARIAWNNFPELKLSTESKAIIDSLLGSVEGKVQQILNPLQNATTLLSSLSTNMIEMVELSKQLPENLRQDLGRKIEDVQKQIQDLLVKVSSPPELVLQRLSELDGTINELINKPVSKGTFFENVLAQIWQTTFVKDTVMPMGGPGRSDLLVIPHLGNRYGDKISIERKAGQNYSRDHVLEAVTHASTEGSKYAMAVYDSADKIPEVFGSMSMEMINSIFIVTTEVQVGWKTARSVIAVFQNALKTEEAWQGIDLKEVRNIVVQMNEFNTEIEELRKKNKSAIKACEAVTKTINRLEELFGMHLDRLQLVLNPGNEETD